MVSSNQNRKRVLFINTEDNRNQTVLKALASKPRVRILKLLREGDFNISEISSKLKIPLSTTTMHVAVLEKAGLIHTGLFSAARGMQKICCRVYDHVLIDLPDKSVKESRSIEYSMPVGSFVNCDVHPTCGLVSETDIIGACDDPASFYEPDRVNAQLIWWHTGFIEYRFPNHLTTMDQVESLELSMEICSKAPPHYHDWLSDITIWINEVEIGTWTSPGDLGGQRGALTPDWWSISHSQFGFLKRWEVTSQGSLVDEVKTSETCLDDLKLLDRWYTSVCIGNKPNANHIGGINLFGKKFGNFPQDILLKLTCDTRQSDCQYRQIHGEFGPIGAKEDRE